MEVRGLPIGLTSLLWAVLADAQPASKSVLVPNSVLRDIDSLGPRAVLARLWTDEALFAGIETGDPKWLEVARRLRAVSDAGATLSLNYAVARALPNAPARVLALIDHGFSIDDVCTSPFLEPEPGVAEDYARRATAALKRVQAPGLERARDQCLAGVYPQP
jgi:hypothetical protein